VCSAMILRFFIQGCHAAVQQLMLHRGVLSGLPSIIRPIWSGGAVPLFADGLSVFCPITWRPRCRQNLSQTSCQEKK